MVKKRNVIEFHSPVQKQIFRLFLLGFLFEENMVNAGMPQLELSNIARFRFQTISFFLMGFLFCSVIIQNSWNYLRTDFKFLPLLSYKKSLAITGLWGLVFLIVLTMISGARELMTPGAWKKKEGETTYVLTDQNNTEPESSNGTSQLLRTQRKSHLERLQGALWLYASRNDGNFPPSIQNSTIPDDQWKLPEKYELKYQYIPGLKPDDKSMTKVDDISKPKIVVHELDVYTDNPFALFNDGSIQQISPEKLIEITNHGETK